MPNPAHNPNPAPAKGDGILADLIAKAEARLADLRAEYQRGETEDLREKYMSEIYDECEKAAAVVEFLKANR